VAHRFVHVMAAAAMTAGVIGSAGGAASAAPPGPPVVLQAGQVIRQDIPPAPGSEPDTVVEPDVAVSPLDANVAIAAAHDGRYPNGGAVDISAAWTRDGGATWHHAPIQGVTTAAGGPYERISDPVVAFGPDGTAYLSVLPLDISSCPSAVAVLRSMDGGQTWGPPSYVDQSSSCDYSEDKDWIVVDSSKTSPHYGRVYVFWTPFLASGINFLGAPQAVRWSDDHGDTWSSTSYVTATNHDTQNSQPMILANGTIVDTYYDYGLAERTPDLAPGGNPESPRLRAKLRRAAALAGANPAWPILAARSADGGLTWQPVGQVTDNAIDTLPDVRCCLFAADVDQVTQVMYVAWLSSGPGVTDPLLISSSRDGQAWSTPVSVSRGDGRGVQRVNADVVARAGAVYVSYGTRTQPGSNGGFVQQQLSVSHDGGASFASPMSIGQRSVLRYAAQSDGFFPGDYIGMALAPSRLYVVWARSSPPPTSSTSPYHQVIDGATLRP
jgi:hypothetical protein